MKSLLASLKNEVCVSIEPLELVVSLVFGSFWVNFIENTSVMILIASGDSCADDTKLTAPWPLMIVCVPAWLTVAIGVSVVLSNRM